MASTFGAPIPMITPEDVKPVPPTGYRSLNARTSFFFCFAPRHRAGHGHAPDRHRFGVPLGHSGREQAVFRRRQADKVTLPKGIPEERF